MHYNILNYIDLITGLKIKPFVIELFKNDSSGHDISHLERTNFMRIFVEEFINEWNGKNS